MFSDTSSSLSSLQTSLVIGFGEVGKALHNILVKANYGPGVLDLNAGVGEPLLDHYDIIHICFPYSKDFIHQVRLYQQKYAPKITVIHSTVPVGTSRDLGAVHSPIRGLHPNLEEGIRTFKKLLGGKQASLVADYFRRAGLTVKLFDRSETTEAAKLFETEYYRHVINFCKSVKKYCDKHGLSFHEVYTIPNQTYNEGYTTLGHPEFVRPVLQPIMTDIGGHCVIPNSEMIDYE